MTVVPLQVKDGFPLVGLESPVDAVRFSLDLSQEIVIALDMGSTGIADLDKCESPQVRGERWIAAVPGDRGIGRQTARIEQTAKWGTMKWSTIWWATVRAGLL